MKLRRRRRVKAFPQKRSQLGGCGLLPAAWGVGPCPAQCIWQGNGFAADQTNAMLAVGGTSCISLVSVAAADENSLTPLHRLLPTETASLGFGGSPVGGGDKTLPFCIFSALLCGGGYHYPRRALHTVETLDARRSRRRIRRFYAAAMFALCGLNLPAAGTHATPAPNRAHSGSHAETRRVLRVDGDDVSGSGIIDTIDPFQADQTVAVALAEGHRNAVSP